LPDSSTTKRYDSTTPPNMDKLLGKAVEKVFGDDDERPEGE
jgi:hypothetical protein